ncbi:MAG: stage sporulation protein, partial [Thermosediminibacterales bacterium]|nr:stage sporulation protein [Thermosediminibacterales bacterium]MDK2836267.1 stage sporulation protein [Thermosediminibacterales bacterium]
IKNKSLINYNKVLDMLERGQITTAEAFVLFRELEEEQVPVSLEKNEEKSKNLDEIMKELDSLVGLDKVKKLVREIKAFVEIQKKREEEKLKTEPIVLHIIFAGNPLISPVKKINPFQTAR